MQRRTTKPIIILGRRGVGVLMAQSTGGCFTTIGAHAQADAARHAARALDQAVELRLQARQHLAVAERADLHVLLLQHHGRRAAPQAEVGVVGFARAVHAAAHDGDGDAVRAARRRSGRAPARRAATKLSFSTREQLGHEMMLRPLPKSGTEMKRPCAHVVDDRRSRPRPLRACARSAASARRAACRRCRRRAASRRRGAS